MHTLKPTVLGMSLDCVGPKYLFNSLIVWTQGWVGTGTCQSVRHLDPTYVGQNQAMWCTFFQNGRIFPCPGLPSHPGSNRAPAGPKPGVFWGHPGISRFRLGSRAPWRPDPILGQGVQDPVGYTGRHLWACQGEKGLCIGQCQFCVNWITITSISCVSGNHIILVWKVK